MNTRPEGVSTILERVSWLSIACSIREREYSFPSGVPPVATGVPSSCRIRSQAICEADSRTVSLTISDKCSVSWAPRTRAICSIATILRFASRCTKSLETNRYAHIICARRAIPSSRPEATQLFRPRFLFLDRLLTFCLGGGQLDWTAEFREESNIGFTPLMTF